MSESSPVERIKRDSRLLRGTLIESLADPLTGAIREDDTVLVKFHGSYQQDDRDIREERRKQRLEPAYSFMIRTRLPGGVCPNCGGELVARPVRPAAKLERFPAATTRKRSTRPECGGA